ncbi:hypothetical protein L228DRAFT_243874 [Xylona heveae TC161]|uniref:Secreted protein n=1 Tax=Xylona heveae (strain CBS 132557 / TC161) TaxID=1328760 RepID=A0A165ILY1_XYLHT|nr:hypothetical protein L228DRAFT_243874 [Xylona heveae TC161]KZF25084.1 hypothetical protein L228DRAFT_243874 [Xylona heveae TC161]
MSGATWLVLLVRSLADESHVQVTLSMILLTVTQWSRQWCSSPGSGVEIRGAAVTFCPTGQEHSLCISCLTSSH